MPAHTDVLNLPSVTTNMNFHTDAEAMDGEDFSRTPTKQGIPSPKCPGAPVKEKQTGVRTIPEPLLDPNPGRYCLFPIQYPEIYDMYLQSVASFWVPQEIDLAEDVRQWDKLTDDERHFLKYVLAFFASADGIVNENLAARFMIDVQPSEARAFYAMQIAIEAIHGETYSLLLDTYVKDTDEKNNLFRAIETIPCVQEKAQWAMKWISDDNTFAERLLGFICVEGIHFSGSFAAIFYLKKRGLMSGLSFANELIARDEGLHANFGCLLYRMLNEKPDEQTVRDIITSAVQIEHRFVKDALPVSLIGMNADLMCQYIEFVADVMMVQLGYDKVYTTRNPFDFMENLSLEGKTNFFEKRNGMYSKSNVKNSRLDKNHYQFTLEADF